MTVCSSFFNGSPQFSQRFCLSETQRLRPKRPARRNSGFAIFEVGEKAGADSGYLRDVFLCVSERFSSAWHCSSEAVRILDPYCGTGHFRFSPIADRLSFTVFAPRIAVRLFSVKEAPFGQRQRDFRRSPAAFPAVSESSGSPVQQFTYCGYTFERSTIVSIFPEKQN